jgi:DNA-binding LytR/AlgR family response regulator
MATIFIVEDDKNHLASIHLKILELGYQIVGTGDHPKTVLSQVRKIRPQIILMDINLNGDNEGIFLSEQIRASYNPSIIFTTALISTEVIDKAVSNSPAGYLVKPISRGDLKANIELALHKKRNQSKEEEPLKDEEKSKFVTIRTGYKLRKIDLKDVKIVKTETKNYVCLVTKDDKNFTVRSSLRTMCNDVLPSNFLQIHRLFVINLNFVKFISEKEQLLFTEKGVHIPIGRTFKKALYEKLNLI